jgi:hypothetical protein
MPIAIRDPWKDNLGLFSLKIIRDFTTACLMKAALTVALWVSLNNHNVGGLLSHYGRFFIFDSSDDSIF